MKRLLPVLLCIACGPSSLQLPQRTTPTLRGQSFQREITTLTDLDTVRDVAEGGTFVYVATDRGLLVYGEQEVPTRMTTAQGLPSDDVRAVSVSAQGTATVATADGLVEVRGNQLENPAVPPSPVGDVVGLASMDDGSRWICGNQGVARLREGSWEGYGEAVQCTGMWPTPEGRLWIGTARGLLYVDADDVIREHGEGRGLPAGWVRGVVPAQPGQAFVLVQNSSESYLGWFDGNRWYAYTVPDFERPMIGLGRVASDTVLFTRGFAFVIRDATRGTGVPLRPLQRSDRLRVLSYRARVTPGAVPPSRVEPLPERTPARLAAVPPNHPTIEAPGFVISPLGPIGESTYLVRTSAGKVFAADRNRGVVAIGNQGPGRVYRSRDLVVERDLQVASDERGKTWLITGEGVVAMMRDGALERVPTPEGVSCSSITAANRGVYLGCVVEGRRNAVRVYRRSGEEWTAAYDGTLTFGVVAEEGVEAPSPTLVSVPMLGVRDDEEMWLALRVTMPDGTGPRLRGVAQINGETVIYHHAYSNPEVDGEGSLVMPDDFGNIDVTDPSMAWFSTINGAVRVGNHQAITFGEARGVRGEVVSDVLVGAEGKVWLAAAEGPGYYANREFEFRMPQAVRAARPIGLAIDRRNNVWGAGPNGLVRYDGSNWAVFGEEAGLPTAGFVDVETDAAGQLWVLGRDRLLLLGAEQRVEAQPE